MSPLSPVAASTSVGGRHVCFVCFVNKHSWHVFYTFKGGGWRWVYRRDTQRRRYVKKVFIGLSLVDHVSGLSSYKWKHEGYISEGRPTRPRRVHTSGRPLCWSLMHCEDDLKQQTKSIWGIGFRFHVNATSILSFWLEICTWILFFFIGIAQSPINKSWGGDRIYFVWSRRW